MQLSWGLRGTFSYIPSGHLHVLLIDTIGAEDIPYNEDQK